MPETNILIDENFYKKRLITAIILVVVIIFIGVMGYHLIEGWSFFDSLYMTVITLATIGYGETHPLTTKGRVFTIFLIFSGIGILGYGLSVIATFVIEGELAGLIGKRRMQKDIEKLSNHYILCGAGETGRCIAQEFAKTKTPFVVIDINPHKIENVRNLNVPFIVGDATKDAILLSAGIKRAQGLVSSLHSDKDNVFVVLTARGLNKDLRIVSRVVEQESEHKLRIAGADTIVSPNAIGGLRMASVMIRPTVVGFLDLMMREQNTIRMEEIKLLKTSSIIGKSLKSSDIGHKTGLIVIAIKRNKGDRYIYNPKPETLFEAEDILVVMGDVNQVQALRKLVK
ncbi:MAG: NAD-binding protein [Acidobacteria bacterium]|nr:NAD-binding protein [Acidobacteriota bacterium]